MRGSQPWMRVGPRNPNPLSRIGFGLATRAWITLWVSNSLSGRNWELNQTPAVRHPTDLVEISADCRACVADL